jgi:hypothetical protein
LSAPRPSLRHPPIAPRGEGQRGRHRAALRHARRDHGAARDRQVPVPCPQPLDRRRAQPQRKQGPRRRRRRGQLPRRAVDLDAGPRLAGRPGTAPARDLGLGPAGEPQVRGLVSRSVLGKLGERFGKRPAGTIARGRR